MTDKQALVTLIFSKPWGELIGRIAEIVAGYPLYALSLLMPRKNNRWVLGTNVGFADNAKYLYFALEKEGEEAYWICPKRKAAKELRAQGVRAYYKYSRKGLHYCLTARYYAFTYHSHDINFFTSGGAKKINLWHGVGIKKGSTAVNGAIPYWLKRFLFPYRNERLAMFLSTSPVMNRHFQQMFNFKNDCIYEGMYPRCAFLRQDLRLIEEHIQQHETEATRALAERMKTAKKVYIYMPTWRATLKDTFIEVAGIDFDEIEQIMQQTDSLFLVKLHPAVKIERTYSAREHVVFMDRNMDIYPILPFTDMLITDYSSIYYDYLLMDNKEVVLYPFDIEEYQRDSDSLAFDYDEYTPGKRVYTFTELVDILQGGSYPVEQREWVVETFWGKNYKEKNTKQLIENIKAAKSTDEKAS